MASGILGQKGEHDWLAVSLTGGQAYEFTVTGLTDLAAVQVGTSSALDEGITALETSAFTTGATATTQNVWFTPDTTGTYYVDVSDPATIGGYSVSAVAVPNALPDNTTTTGVVTVGGSPTTGTLGQKGEHDWLAVGLTGGQAYEFTVTGLTDLAAVQVGTSSALDEGITALETSAFTTGATATTQNVWFTPDTTGTYYVDVSDPATIGGYAVSAVAVPNALPDNTTTTGVVTVGGSPTTGTLGQKGEHDWLAVSLTGGQAYEFTVTGLTDLAAVQVGTSSALDEGITALETSAFTTGATATTQNVWFTPDTTGTYYVDVSDPATIGGYSVSAVAVPNALPDNTTTTGVVTVGGSPTTGMLGQKGEHDWLAVSLTGGQAYEFTVTGLTDLAAVQVGTSSALDEGITALETSAFTTGATATTQNVWFTPDTTGTYYVDVSDPATIGGYAVSAVAVPNALPDNTTTTGVVTVGGSPTTGTLGQKGEHDWLAVSLTGGQAYEFTVTGLTDLAAVQVGTSSALDEGITALETSAFTTGATATTQNVWFTPDTTGTYYVDVSDPATIGGYSVSAVAVSNDFPDNTTTTGVVTLCFARGTQIATPAGEVSVERLTAGDSVCTFDGRVEPIVWIGIGRVIVTPGRRSPATPVIVRKGALGPNTPNRDLRVTKGHSLYLDGVLIPVEFLVNHRSIAWDDRVKEIEVYHLELPRHAVLIADGAPAESYRDDGNRWLFQNISGNWHLPPQPPCAPVLTGGPVVDAIWRRLLDLSGPRPGFPLTDDPDLHLLVDGQRVDRSSERDGIHLFHLAKRPADVRIVSRAAVPQELGTARNSRLLGVALRRIAVWRGRRLRLIEASEMALQPGFRSFEESNRFCWTSGDARLPAALSDGMDGSCTIELHVACTTQYALSDEKLRLAAA